MVLCGNFVFVAPVMAQYYGQGGNSVQIVVDKMVRPISDKVFYDNIDPNKKTFSQNETIEFKIVVENTSSNELTEIKVEDKLPKYFSLIFYPGTYIADSRSIVTSIAKLSPGEKKEYLVRGKISMSQPVTDEGKKIQQINFVKVTSGSVSDSDEAKYFISGLTIPNTGFGDVEIRTLVAIVIAFGGISLRKIVRGY